LQTLSGIFDGLRMLAVEWESDEFNRRQRVLESAPHNFPNFHRKLLNKPPPKLPSPQSYTHVIVPDNYAFSSPADVERVKALGGAGAVLVPLAWLHQCLVKGQLLSTAEYERAVVNGAALAAAAAAAEPLPREVDSDDDPMFEPEAFVPPTAENDGTPFQKCNVCDKPLLWVQIGTCQPCIVERCRRTNDSKQEPDEKRKQLKSELLLRLLHLRYRVDHPNKQLVLALLEWADYLELRGVGNYRTRVMSRQKAAAALRATPRNIRLSRLNEDLADIPLVGPKMRESYIPEILRTGTHGELESFRENASLTAALRMSKLPYIGAVLAKEWTEKGWLTPAAVLAGLAATTGLDKLKEWKQLVLIHADALLTPITPEDRAPLDALISRCADKAAAKLSWAPVPSQPVGGFARGKLGSHDYDVLFKLPHTFDAGKLIERGFMEVILTELSCDEELELDPVTKRPIMLVVTSANAESDDLRGSASRAWRPGSRGEPAPPFLYVKDAKVAHVLIKLKEKPLRHVDLVMSPLEEHAFCINAWVGSTILRRFIQQYCHSLECENQSLKLNSRCLRVRTDAKLDVAPRVNIFNKLIDPKDVPEEYIRKETYPKEEKQVWEMLGLPFRDFCDRNA